MGEGEQNRRGAGCDPVLARDPEEDPKQNGSVNYFLVESYCHGDEQPGDSLPGRARQETDGALPDFCRREFPLYLIETENQDRNASPGRRDAPSVRKEPNTGILLITAVRRAKRAEYAVTLMVAA
jgi:hypothetical protein